MLVFDVPKVIDVQRMGDAPDEPEETLGGGVLLGLDLVAAEILDVLGLGRGSELPVTDLLYWGRSRVR